MLIRRKDLLNEPKPSLARLQSEAEAADFVDVGSFRCHRGNERHLLWTSPRRREPTGPVGPRRKKRQRPHFKHVRPHLLETVASVENNRRQQDIEEHLGVKGHLENTVERLRRANARQTDAGAARPHVTLRSISFCSTLWISLESISPLRVYSKKRPLTLSSRVLTGPSRSEQLGGVLLR